MPHPYASRPNPGSYTWLTPPAILDALGEFDLDPCAAPSPRPWATAARHIEPPADGLSEPWEGRVWCNPPFGAHTGNWLAKLALHGNGIALAFARTDTAMFQRSVFGVAHAVLFLSGRPHFHRRDGLRAHGNSGGPICLIAYGQDNARALLASRLPGAIAYTLSTSEGC